MLARMKTDRRRYTDPCGIARALDVVGERWALLIVRELMLGPRRFGQLRDGLPDTSPNVLSQRLRELEDDGVVTRVLLEPPASVVVYELTERGMALEPILVELGRWGSATPRVPGREMSSASMLFALKTMFAAPADVHLTYGLQLGDEQFALAVADGELTVTRGRPAEADARIATDVGELRMVVFLGRPIRDAERAGTMTISGDRRAAARLPKLFRQPVSA
jgi:DNA-binding HxlR family transcriptional regulator